MDAVLLTTATHLDASSFGSASPMPTRPTAAPMHPVPAHPISMWSMRRNLTGAVASSCTFTQDHCPLTDIYGTKRVTTGRLPEDLT